MFGIFEDQESRILGTAFARLCRPDAEDSERDELRLLLLELAQNGVTDVDDLVTRAQTLLDG